MMAELLVSLRRACRELVKALAEECGADAAARLGSSSYDAFQIVITHGGQAWARVFAETSCEARVVVEGEDNPESKRIGGVLGRPVVSFGLRYGLEEVEYLEGFSVKKSQGRRV